MNIFKSLLFLLILLLSLNTYSVQRKALAKVIKVRGSVYNLQTNKTIKKGDWLTKGSIIVTKSRSFAKILFLDKSKMSIGPKSKIVIESFPRKKAGIITLIKGQIRSKVTKNYMDMSNKDKSKFFIKTRTAAMGVRGTDFQVNYNEENENTSLITFEGAVALGALNDSSTFHDANYLEKIVSGATAVMVRRGEFSGVMPKVNSKPLVPIKINFKQLKELEKSTVETSVSKTTKRKRAPARNILPPGVEGKDFASKNKEEAIKQIQKIDKKVRSIASVKEKSATPVPEKGRALLRSGGLLIIDKVVYVQPPKDALVDPISKEVVMPRSYGYVCNGGKYCNDNYKYSNTKGWVKKELFGRVPASSSNFPSKPDAIVPVKNFSNKQIIRNSFCENCREEILRERIQRQDRPRTKIRFIRLNK